MSASGRGVKRVTVIGGGLLGLSTAINIQENVPDVRVEIVNDKEDSGCYDHDDCCGSTDGGGNKHQSGEASYEMDDEANSSLKGICNDDHGVACVEATSLSTTPEPSFTNSLSSAYSHDDVIWLPQSIPGLDDDLSGRGAHYRFWSVLTWYHLYELTWRESSSRTGVRLLPDYILYHWKNTQVCDWWKDLVPDYRPLNHDGNHHQTSTGLGYGSSFTTAVVNIPRYIKYLTRRFLNCGGKFKGHLSSINELARPCNLLVNCSYSNLHQIGDDKAYNKQLPMLKSIQGAYGLQHDQCAGSRLEATTILHNQRPLSVIHSCGYNQDQLVTIHWGCGQETARLASDILAGRFIRPTSKL